MNLGQILKKYQLGGNLPDTSRGSMVISPEQAIALAKQRGFGQLSQKDQIRIGNNIYANELAKKQRDESQQRDIVELTPKDKPKFDYGNVQTDDYGDKNEVNPFDYPSKKTESKRVYKDVILDGQRVKKWVGEDGKLYDSENGVVLPKPIEIQGDKYERPLKYKYKGIEYQKIDNQWMWKSNKTGALHIAKNFNDDFIARNKLSPLGQDNVSNSNNADELYYRVINNPEDMKAFSYATKHSPNDETIKQVSEMLKTQGIEIPKIKSQKQPKQSSPKKTYSQPNISVSGNNTIWDDGKVISAPRLERLSGTLTEEENPDLNDYTVKIINKYMVSPNDSEREAANFILGNLNRHYDLNAATNWKGIITDHNLQKAINQIHTEVLNERSKTEPYRTRSKNNQNWSESAASILKNYSFGGDLGKFALNNLEQSALGMLGLDFYKPKFEYDTMGKINEVTQGVGKAVNSLAPAALNMVLPGSGAVLGAVQGVGKQISKFQQGGIMPQNPSDLEDVTENTVEYNGNPHTKGGIPLGNGKELEKDETVIKQGAIGNKDPYAISPNLVLDRKTAKMVGLSAKYVGMKLSDISRKIEDMKPQKENDPMSVKTNSMNKKFALNRLIKANELLSAQHRQENPIPQEMSDLRMEEMQKGGSLGQGFMEWAASKGLEPDEQNWYEYSKFVNNPIFEIKSISPSLKLPMNTSLPTQTALPEQYINPGKSRNFNINDNLDKIGMGLKGASLLANFATIGKKPGQIPAQFNPYATEILDNYRNSIDNQAIKNDITSTLNTGLNSNPSRSWNIQRATNAELTGKAMEAMSKANLQNQELNNRYRTELGDVQNQLGSQNVQAKNMAEILNAQTEANWRKNLRNAIGSVGNDVADMALKKDYLNKYTAEHMKILNEKGKDYGISFTTTEDYLKIITNPEAALILGKIQNKTATPEEIQKLKDIQAGKAVDYTTKKQ